ncbi:MAG: TerB N-terminal domain-containing protein [Turicibacter sp.]|nr:TerB N-terminal domain-containing protein [Turicibacter sp.]
MPTVTEIRCKQALNKINKQGLSQEWDLNLYRGCQHGCVYCFAMYSHDYISPNSNYYDDLYVKINIVERLEKQLSSPNWKPETIAIAGVTDCYQPIEAKYQLMPEILKLMIKYKNPVVISTKSDLILRDYDLIDELSRITDVTINSSIVCMDNEIRRKIEPVGRNAKQKFNMLKEFSKTNARTGLLQMPIIPYITDSRENIEDLYAHAADAGVDYVVPGMLYLRGKTRGVFFDFIKREFPDLFIPLTKLYQKGGRDEYKRGLYRMIGELRRQYRLQSWYAKSPSQPTVSQPTVSQPIVSETENLKKIAEGFQQLSLFESTEPAAYQSAPIPSREQLTPRPARETPKPVAESDLASFVEIEMGSKAPSSYQTAQIPEQMVPTASPIEAVADEKRTLFYQMRQIARDTRAYADHSKIFYDQATFMADFEDDYEKSVPFSAYYPYYQKMGYEQLRTYFTWRAEVRNGNITATATSYAFLYVYELLNQIGASSPEDGLNRLTTFWQSFRAYDDVLDQYVIQWLKDYHVFYPLPYTFREFALQHNLMMHYPSVFGYDSDKAHSFELFAGISKYDIKKSVFYSDETQVMINDCFHFILERMRGLFREQGHCFEDLIFYPLNKVVAWTPFNRALFYPAFLQTNREVMLSEKEAYQCHENRWRYQSVMLTDGGRRLVDYLMKQMEAVLRQTVKFKYKLTANLNMCDDKSLAAFARMGIALPELIQTCVKAFYTEFTRKIITVDTGNLQQIRTEALQTQEKLIVPEDSEPANLVKESPAPVIAPTLPVSAETNVTLDPWQDLKSSFTPVEAEALAVIFEGRSVKEFALQKAMMLEVLVDGINDKAMDAVGDAIVEIEDDVVVYEDYEDDVRKLVKG